MKLKGGGVEKKKKKKKAKTENDEEGASQQEKTSDTNTAQTALQKALAEEGEVQGSAKAADSEVKEYGKTEAQRRFEERRKKRVGTCRAQWACITSSILLSL